MGNCLITKLKGVVQNDNLLRLGEIKADFTRTGSSGTANVTTLWKSGTIADNCKVRVLGTTLQDGTTERICNTGGSGVPYYTTINKVKDAKVFISEKYNLEELTFGATGIILNTQDIIFMPNLKSISGGMTGFISDLLTLRQEYNKLERIFIYRGDIEGNIEDLNPIASALKTFACSYVDNVTGDITTLLNNLTSLTTGIVDVTQTKLTMDLSAVNHDAILCMVSGSNVVNHTWKNTRSSERKIIAISGGNFGDSLDAMLINQANCQVGYTGHESDSRFKQIKCAGTRTSASDSAVSALKTKGYSVTINGVLL